MKAVNSELNKREKKFSTGKFGGSHQVYLNHSPEIITTVHSDKKQFTKDIDLEKPDNNSKIQSVMYVRSKSAYYIEI